MLLGLHTHDIINITSCFDYLAGNMSMPHHYRPAVTSTTMYHGQEMNGLMTDSFKNMSMAGPFSPPYQIPAQQQMKKEEGKLLNA